MSLEIIVGCMFSGKSTELIRRLKRFRAIDTKILVINSSKDIRSTRKVLQTHDKVTFDCVKTNNLLEVLCTDDFEKSEIIGIDEAQFFTHLKDFVQGALSRNKHIIVAGLDGDYKQERFGEIIELLPLADDITKLKALCMECNDGTLAPFTKRVCEIDSQELVGAKEYYKAVCRRHLKN